MFTVTVVGARGAGFVIARLAVGIKKGGANLSRPTVERIVSTVTIHDYRSFRYMQAQQKNRITLPTAIFSRVINRTGIDPNATIRTLEQKVGRVHPLEDTGRLINSVGDIHSPDMKIEVTVLGISVRNLVPYYKKQARGRSLLNTSVFEMFEFGPVERKRLEERVPPPPPGKRKILAQSSLTEREQRRAYRDKVRPAFYAPGDVVSHRFIHPETGKEGFRTRRKKGKLLFRESETGDLKSTRPYYRLRNWASARYPTIAAIPARAWLLPLPPEIVQAIGEMVRLDLMEKSR